jgi:hypothetical protein
MSKRTTRYFWQVEEGKKVHISSLLASTPDSCGTAIALLPLAQTIGEIALPIRPRYLGRVCPSPPYPTIERALL